MDGHANGRNLLFDERVVIVGVAAKAEWLAKVDSVFGRQRRNHSDQKLRQYGKRRRAEERMARADWAVGCRHSKGPRDGRGTGEGW